MDRHGREKKFCSVKVGGRELQVNLYHFAIPLPPADGLCVVVVVWLIDTSTPEKE